jgi:hypothetical protein
MLQQRVVVVVVTHTSDETESGNQVQGNQGGRLVFFRFVIDHPPRWNPKTLTILVGVVVRYFQLQPTQKGIDT